MIEFKNVSKTYDTGTEAVKNASFVIEKGDFAFLVGILCNKPKPTSQPILPSPPQSEFGVIFTFIYFQYLQQDIFTEVFLSPTMGWMYLMFYKITHQPHLFGLCGIHI